jgi:hypothetical protein
MRCVLLCLAMRYEALLLPDAKYCNDLHLQVSHLEWLTFTTYCLDNGFYTIVSKVVLLIDNLCCR